MRLYLGIDLSTQGIKCVVVDANIDSIVGESAVNFGRDLPQYASPEGHILNQNPLLCHADPRMWLDGLELVFTRLSQVGIPLAQVLGIAGSAQQHGSVYLKDEICAWDKSISLSEQIFPMLSRPTSPIWLDRTTSKECSEISNKFSTRIQQDTGSPASERFTAAQIRRFANNHPKAYAKTNRIHLISSFLSSVLCGTDTAIDYGDGAGMNLLNLRTLQWDEEIVEFIAPDLLNKLPPVRESQKLAGNLDTYFTRFGFRAGIPVLLSSGDNPSSLIGVGAAIPGIVGISLGTSDTLFTAIPKYQTDPDGYGHVFGNPAGGFMSLICISNGSLAREKVKTIAGVDWEYFGKTACSLTTPGNDGRLMLPYFTPENTPLVLTPGVKRNYVSATREQEIRTILESQALALRLHSSWQGNDYKRLRVTGGGSQATGLLQILADVFQTPVETISISNSAGLGAALRAISFFEDVDFSELSLRFCPADTVIYPEPAQMDIYANSLEKYAYLENTAICN